MMTDIPNESSAFNDTDEHNSTCDNDDSFEFLYQLCLSYVYQIIYAVGLVGNIFALLIWARSGLRVSPVLYFQAICVADSLVLILHGLATYHSVNLIGVCQISHVLYLAVQVFAILLVLGLSVERYIELCRPLMAEVLITQKRSVRTILGLAAVSIALSSVEAYMWNMDSQTKECELRYNVTHDFIWTYAFLVLVVLFLLPLMAIIIINIVIIRRVKRRRFSSTAYSRAMVPAKHKINASFVFVSLYLALCEIIYAVVHLSQYFVSVSRNGQVRVTDMHMTGRWNSYYVDSVPMLVMDVITLTSYSVDVTIFTLCSRTFRRTVKELFHRYKRRKSLMLGYRQPIY